MARLTRRDFERLLEFRVTLRRFQRWSEDQAQAAGLTHVQHQLLVAIKGHPGDTPPAVGDIAGYLLLRPHSAVELVDRAEVAGLVKRAPDGDDGRVVRVRLAAAGDRIVQQLTQAELDRLHELATVLDELVKGYETADPGLPRSRLRRNPPGRNCRPGRQPPGEPIAHGAARSGEQAAGHDAFAHVTAEPQVEMVADADVVGHVVPRQAQGGQSAAAPQERSVILTGDQGREHPAVAGIVVAAAHHHAVWGGAELGAGTVLSAVVQRDQGLVLVSLHRSSPSGSVGAPRCGIS